VRVLDDTEPVPKRVNHRRYFDALADLSDWLKRGGPSRSQMFKSHLDISDTPKRLGASNERCL